MKRISLLAAAAVLSGVGVAQADVSICISVSATGPASALGQPQQNSVRFLPAEAGGQTLRYTVFDDATDTSLATQNARKCVNEQNVDILIGGSGTPTTVAIATVAAEAGVPFLSLAPFVPRPEQAEWSFVVPQPMRVMVQAMVEDMQERGIATLGFIGFNDSLGDLTLNELQPLLEGAGLTLSPVERFARNDTSVSAQALKVVAEAPEAVLVVGSGAPAAGPNLALAELGYSGVIYHTHGSASQAFLQVAGDSANGTVMPVGPIGVVDQLPEGHPAREPGLAYKASYEDVYGGGSVSSFGGYLYDAGLIAASAVPVALEQGEPGTPEFRAALRDAIEASEGVPGVHGAYAASAESRELADNETTRILTTVVDGVLTIAQ